MKLSSFGPLYFAIAPSDGAKIVTSFNKYCDAKSLCCNKFLNWNSGRAANPENDKKDASVDQSEARRQEPFRIVEVVARHQKSRPLCP